MHQAAAASSLKRTLTAHLKAGFHTSLATAHRLQKRALEKALTQSEELLARLFRTMLHTVDCYNSFLSFEKVPVAPRRAACPTAAPLTEIRTHPTHSTDGATAA